jgi:hypothetical protein
MTAIITSKFRINAAKFIKEDVSNNPYFMFLGRTQVWPNEDITALGIDQTVIPPLVDSFTDTHYSAFTNMHSLKKIESDQVELCARRNIWTLGTKYRPWNSFIDTNSSSSFLTGPEVDSVVVGRNVFVCLYAPIESVTYDTTTFNIDAITHEPSTVMPAWSGNTLEKVVQSADKYIWKFLYEISDSMNSNFTTNDYIPVPDPISTSTDIRDVNQMQVQAAAVKGKVYSFQVTNGGKYTLTHPGTSDPIKPVIRMYGDSSNLNGTDIPADQITMGIYIDSSGASPVTSYYIESISPFSSNPTDEDLNGSSSNVDNNANAWSRLNLQVIGLDSGLNEDVTLEHQAVVNAILPPPGGFGKSAQLDLGANNLGINGLFNLTNPDGSVANGSSYFHEIGIMTGVTTTDSNNDTVLLATDTNESPLYKLELPTGAAIAFNNTPIIKQTKNDSTLSKAYVDYIDVTNDHIYYHHAEDLGFNPFEVTSSIESTEDSSITSSIDSIIPPTFNKYTGDVVYFEKRHKVKRVVDQIENIKLVIEL